MASVALRVVTETICVKVTANNLLLYLSQQIEMVGLVWIASLRAVGVACIPSRLTAPVNQESCASVAKWMSNYPTQLLHAGIPIKTVCIQMQLLGISNSVEK